MKINKKVGIVGYGYVGKAVFDFFKDHYETIFYDPHMDGSATKDELNACDLALVSVPTPMSEDGRADTSIVEETMEWLATPLIVLKSTVPPGTTKSLIEKYNKRIVFNPEYIGEGNYEVPFWKEHPHPRDMKKHHFMIFGGNEADATEVGEYFKRVLGAEARYVYTDSTTAELCKYIENAFLATKVTFCNEFYEIARALGVNYDELREMWLLDGRIGRSHTAVFKDARGFGGKCLPKDTSAIVKRSEEAGYEPKLLKAVLAVNKEIRGD
jgi:UDPglucose 6-dehydrogenase